MSDASCPGHFFPGLWLAQQGYKPATVYLRSFTNKKYRAIFSHLASHIGCLSIPHRRGRLHRTARPLPCSALFRRRRSPHAAPAAPLLPLAPPLASPDGAGTARAHATAASWPPRSLCACSRPMTPTGAASSRRSAGPWRGSPSASPPATVVVPRCKCRRRYNACFKCTFQMFRMF
jgi:hypothetical protein